MNVHLKKKNNKKKTYNFDELISLSNIAIEIEIQCSQGFWPLSPTHIAVEIQVIRIFLYHKNIHYLLTITPSFLLGPYVHVWNYIKLLCAF